MAWRYSLSEVDVTKKIVKIRIQAMEIRFESLQVLFRLRIIDMTTICSRIIDKELIGGGYLVTGSLFFKSWQ